jgi:signal transduction histidine kinase/HAMP domain-containing protein
VRPGIGIRWWLSLAFAAIAAMTAVAVSQLSAYRSEDRVRTRAQNMAARNADQAAIELARADERGRLGQAIAEVADEQRMALFVYARDGRLVTAARSRDVSVGSIRFRDEAVRDALAGNRFVMSNDPVRATTVGLRFRFRSGENGALLAFAYHPDLAAALGIVHHEIVVAALWAIVLGGIVGFLVASFMAARLRRVARAAAAIEAGDLETPLRPGFGDEVGGLGATIERMRQRLGESFRRLASERDRLGRLVERLHEGVLSVHADLSVELANAEARRLLGSPRLRAGHRLPDPWPAFRLESFVAALFAPDAGPAEVQVAIDGDRTLQIAGLPPAEGSDTAIVVLADVSERERRERAEREFVANAAHELRTPLTTIVGAVDALQAGAKDDPVHRDRFLGHIERESGRLARLTRALLVLARAQTHQEAPLLVAVPARDLLEDVRDGMTPADGVAVDVECDDAVVLHTERDLVEQALANLAANAVRHTEHGRILLAARTLEGGRVELEVTDTGTGIAPADRERIFERFYRAHDRDPGGFGLGLSIVRQAVVALGGTIDAHSAPGSGTRVRIQLPAAVDEAA